MPELDEGVAVDLDEKHVIHGFGFVPLVVKESRGCYYTDIQGRKWLDFVAGNIGEALIGHSHPRVVEAIKRQADNMVSANTVFSHLPRTELAEKLAKTTPKGLTKSLFLMSGSQATEAAIKAAMKITRRKEVISLYGGFHGLTLGTMSLSQPWYRVGYPVFPGFKQIPPPYCYRCPWGQTYPGCHFECAHSLEDAIKYTSSNEVAAFIVEPIMGPLGHVLPPDNEYYRIIRETCDRYGALLIADEVQTGFGRTGKMWGVDYFGLVPDIMCLGKALGGGLPMSAAVFREDILGDTDLNDRWYTHTHAGYPLGCAAASAVLDVIQQERLPERAARMGAYLTRKLQGLAEKHGLIGDIRGPGLFVGIEIVRDRNTKETGKEEADILMAKCFSRRLILHQSHYWPDGKGNVIKMKPALIVTEEQIDQATDTFDESLTEVEKERSSS